MRIMEFISRHNRKLNANFIPALPATMIVIGWISSVLGFENLSDVMLMIGWPLFWLTALPIWGWYFVKNTRPADE